MWSAVALAAVAAQPDPLIEPAEVARALRFDRPVRAEDITPAARFRNPNVLWSGNFLSADEALPTATIVVSRGRTELTEEVKGKLLAASKHEIRLPNGQKMPPTARPLKLPNGAEGFCYLAGFGPGGTSYAAVVTTPDGKYDIAIALGFAADGPIRQDIPQASDNPVAADHNNTDVFGTLESALTTVYSTLATNASSRPTELIPSGPAPVPKPSGTEAVSDNAPVFTPSSKQEIHENVTLKRTFFVAVATCAVIAIILFRRSKQ